MNSPSEYWNVSTRKWSSSVWSSTRQILQNRSLYYQHGDETDNETDYCVNEKNGTTTYYYCKDLVDKTLLIHLAAKIIPIPFLLATFLVFVILPKRNIHKKALIFHTLCLIPGNILLAVNQYYVIESYIICVGSGYIMLYCLSTSYFWMNVMSIDVWLTFSRGRKFRRRLGEENVVFVILSIYGWGAPGLILLIVALLDAFGDATKDYWPGIGKGSCFLRDLPSVLFYFGPVICLIIFNCILFTITTINIKWTKREVAILKRVDSRRHIKRDDEKSTLYWNLLIVMGINPIVVSSHLILVISWTAGWLANSRLFIYITFYKDLAHVMHGIVTFAVFVCKKRIWKNLKERYRQFTRKLNGNKSSRAISIKPPNQIIEMSNVRLTRFKKIEITSQTKYT